MRSLAWEVIGVIETDGDCAEWSFPAEPGAVRTARAAVRGQLHGWDLDCLADLAALLVSELVTNSLRHATGPIGVRLVRPGGLDGALLVEVSDPLPDPPRERVARSRTRTDAVCNWSPERHAAGGPVPARTERPSGSNWRCPGEGGARGGSRGVGRTPGCRRLRAPLPGRSVSV